MSTTIHLHIEIKHAYLNKWIKTGFKGEFSNKDYKMFAVLADVRNEHDLTTIAPKRGVPDDIGSAIFNELYIKVDDYKELVIKSLKGDINLDDECYFVKDNEVYYEDPDSHSISWCTPEELAKAVQLVYGDCSHIEVNNSYAIDWISLSCFMRSFAAYGIKCRAVFWFDN